MMINKLAILSTEDSVIKESPLPKTPPFAEEILVWAADYGRNSLPWVNSSLYHTWISEIMLQQTQVATVLPYFNRFIDRFPNLKSLATATEQDVLSFWSGLGYYARGRNLHKAGQALDQNNENMLPESLEEWLKLPGVGLSTASAILSLGLNKPYAILDGNVKRILARYFALSGSTQSKLIEKKFWEYSYASLSKDHPAKFNQAMMDLGATICTKHQPNCQQCPIKKGCRSKDSPNYQKQFPNRKYKKPKSLKKIIFLILLKENKIFLNKIKTKVWQNLFAFPSFESEEALSSFLQANKNFFQTSPQLLTSFSHQFTHVTLSIKAFVVSLTNVGDQINLFSLESGNFYLKSEALNLPLASPIKTLLNSI